MLDLNHCDKACLRCIKGYKKKHNLVAGQTFDISCEGITKFEEHINMLGSIPEGEQSTARAILDPVAWASETLDWHCVDEDGEVWKRRDPGEYIKWREDNPDTDIKGHSRYHRPYQADMLRCSSQFKAFRIGRQAGKCLASGTLIQMADGTMRPVEEVNDGDLVVSVDGDYKTVINPAYRACNGIKPTFRVVLMDGRTIEATENHPFLSRSNIGRETTGNRRAVLKDEWIETKNLTTDDYIAVPRQISIDRQEGVGDYHMTILGCLIADGNITSNNCRFSNTNQVILDHLSKALAFLQCSLKQYDSDQSDCDYHIKGHGVGRKHPIKEWMKSLELYGLGSHEKYIPDFFMTLEEESIAELLRCMFGCDGWASVGADGSCQVGYSTVSEKLASQVIALLARYGIYSDIRVKTVKLNGKKYLSRQLCITRKESIANFRNKIGILGKEKELERVYAVSQSKNSSPKTEVYEDNDLAFIKVREVIPLGEQMTWDLTVPETHNFIANNIVTHNTEAIVVSMLYHMFVKPGIPEDEGFKIVVIAPYQAQIDLIFSRLAQLIRSNPVTNNSLRRNVKAPVYTMELHNGSRVMGFTAGTKSGGNADSVRGQHAHMLVFDEADYLCPKDLESALSIITNHPNASIWMSSTPSGKREKFYQVCNSKEWIEFHYTSRVNPMWDDKKEVLFKGTLTELAFQHEILAQFGEQEEGVFQNVLVQAAKERYNYGDFAYMNTWTYTMGVDWNDTKNGTCIVVLGFDPKRKVFIIVDRDVISREGWTQLAACQRVADLNRIWNPICIYIDSGFGGTQWEVLRKFGYDSLANPEKGPAHPDSRLRDIVKKYDFGSSVEVYDLFTRQPIKKPAKSFLVESTVRRFEVSDIKFPESDEELEHQLLGYIVDRITATGVPIYKAGDVSNGDHVLDALMCAIIGVTMEVSPLGKRKYSSNLAIASYFGDRLDVDIYEGDTVIKHDNPRRKQEEVRTKARPEMKRTSGIENKTLLGVAGNIPARNLSNDSQVRSWTWPGFLRDESAPKVRTLGEAVDEARKRKSMRPINSRRPRRKNI